VLQLAEHDGVFPGYWQSLKTIMNLLKENKEGRRTACPGGYKELCENGDDFSEEAEERMTKN
jgi:hypothetical protein